MQNLVALSALTAAILVAPAALAQTAQSKPYDEREYGFEFKGVVDISYDWDDVLGPPGLHVFDVNQPGFSVHQVNVTLTKSVRDCLDVTVNGIFGDDAAQISEDGIDFDLTEAHIDGYACLHPAFSFKVGRFGTLAGIERIDPSKNVNASRGLMFFFQPLLHTGARTKYNFTDELSVTFGINNGVVNFTQPSRVDNNTDLTVEMQVAYEHPRFGLRLTAISGDEDPAPTGGAMLNTQTIDVVATTSWGDSIDLALNASTTSIDDIFGNTITRDGIAGYLNWKLGDYRIAPRFEYMDLDAGATESLWVREWTLTFGYRASPDLEFLAEIRNDEVDVEIGGLPPRDANDPNPNDDQYTATIKAIITF